MTKRLVAVFALAGALSLGLSAQKKEKPWTEWSKKDAEKILNDSPWGQTQTFTDTSQMTYSPTDAGRASDNPMTNQATDVKYRIRFFSARPVRQAFARTLLLNAKEADPKFEERMRLFAEMPSNEKIVVAVTIESRDQRFLAPAMQVFNSAVTATLKNNTYLEVKGKRLFVEQYTPPVREGFGALFIFPRTVGEGPLITPEGGDVRFVSELAKNIKLDMKFKVSQMVYDGKLEY